MVLLKIVKLIGAALPSTLVLGNTMKVDLPSTREDSSAKTFILIPLFIILVKSFFFICEDACLIISEGESTFQNL